MKIYSPNSKFIIFLLVTIYFFMCLGCQCCHSKHTFSKTGYSTYIFDAGSSKLLQKSGVIALTINDLYHLEKGFGWIEEPDSEFTLLKFYKRRDSLTIDGVSGDKIGFKADLPPGKWHVILWIDAGYEDSTTISVIINDKKQALNWQSFRPPAEGRSTRSSLYRIYQTTVEVNSRGLEIDLTGGKYPVDLLGFKLIPKPEQLSDIQQNIYEHIQTIGRYNSELTPDSILEALDQMLTVNPSDRFAAYWKQQLTLLKDAERLYHMRGWEWASEKTGLGIFDRYHQAIMLMDGLVNDVNDASNLLRERVMWYRGRLLYWLYQERHGAGEYRGAKRDLSWLYHQYPEDTLLAIYNGKKIKFPDPCDTLISAANAPVWSISQHEALCRMREIIYWWVNEQQALNGEFGGKLGDDVELLRWWTPVILTGDTIALKGWQRLAHCVWESPKTDNGYARNPSDVEHSSEFISDTAPLMVLYTDEPEYLDWLRYSAEHFQELWTGISNNGNRFFKSAWFSSSTVEMEPPKNRDVEYNTRAVKAVRYYAWKTGDLEVVQSLVEWSQAWKNAAMRTDKGKPAGIIPPSIRFPDEAINGDEPTWYIANMYWDYFDWYRSEGSRMLDQLLFTYKLTGDSNLLEPLYAALKLIQKHDSKKRNEELTPGSEAWAAHILKQNVTFWSVVEQWRFLTGNNKFDELLLLYGTPYLKYRLTGDKTYLTEALETLLESIRYNTPLLTSEVMHTDRVYVPGSIHLKAMLTGNGIPESMSPYYAISWENTDRNFTALVADASSDYLSVEIFSHRHHLYVVNMRLWQLQDGKYKITIMQDDKKTKQYNFELLERGQRISLELPSQKLIKVLISKD